MIRVGHGYDLHRLQTGGKLLMGGIVVADGISPIAHSDGDVVMHAIVDALLGAAGLGDIGERFPDSDPKWKNAASSLFIEHTINVLKQKGWKAVNADVTILAERPRLKQFKAQMQQKLRELLQCDVNIKAGTNEGCDAVGRGEAVAAHAVVLIQRS